MNGTKGSANFNFLGDRKLFIPEMDYGASRTLAAAFRSEGINAEVVPPSTEKSLKLGLAVTSGDECYPTQITLGDLLHILDSNLYRPKDVAFFMPTAEGPCRFGQYATLIKKILDAKGYGDTLVLSPTSENGYDDLSEHSSRLQRTAWRGVLIGDLLRRLLHTIRPYENRSGDTDSCYSLSIERICKILERQNIHGKRQLVDLLAELERIREEFLKIPTSNKGSRPLIGVVGEIFCRLNTFSNNDLVRRLEQHGAECWLSGVCEWVLYTNSEQIRKLKGQRRFVSKKMLTAVVKDKIMKKDLSVLTKPFEKILFGREDVTNIGRFLKYSEPYLPHTGALGEMTLNAAGAVHFYHAGAAGVVDISPFTCMNGIVCEAVYPKISRDYKNIPIRVFYFDGTSSNLDRDIGIFLELAKNFKTTRPSHHI